jgi:hypothetical protein
MSYSPWDWADRFRLSEAACLIAGVPVESKWEQTLDEVPIDAMPVFRRLVEAVAVGAALLNRPDDPKYPKKLMLRTLWPEMPSSSLPIVNSRADIGEANESFISRAELHVMTGWKVSRDEIHRWVNAMGFHSAYDFGRRAHERPAHDMGSCPKEMDIAPVVTTPPVEPGVADSASGTPAENIPDAERRLFRLRALGGSAKYRRGEWKFTGITDLVASEKTEDRKRRDEKTIRADLKEAAQAERDGKQAGHWDGLRA